MAQRKARGSERKTSSFFFVFVFIFFVGISFERSVLSSIALLFWSCLELWPFCLLIDLWTAAGHYYRECGSNRGCIFAITIPGQVALGDTRCGRSHLGRELAVGVSNRVTLG